MFSRCPRLPVSVPGSSVHGILQVRILEWVAISFSRGLLLGRWIFFLPLRHQEIQVGSLGQEEPLEEEVAAHSSYSCLENPMEREEPGGPQSMRLQSQTQLSDQA